MISSFYKYNYRYPSIYVYFNVGEEVKCVFCGIPDLRLGGRMSSSFIACPHCEADGPVGLSPYDALNKYMRHREHIQDTKQLNKG